MLTLIFSLLLFDESIGLMLGHRNDLIPGDSSSWLEGCFQISELRFRWWMGGGLWFESTVVLLNSNFKTIT